MPDFHKIDPKVLREMIDCTLFSVSLDPERGQGAQLFTGRFEDSIMVATDGHRLTKVERPLTRDLVLPEKGIVIPLQGLRQLRKMTERHETMALGYETVVQPHRHPNPFSRLSPAPVDDRRHIDAILHVRLGSAASAIKIDDENELHVHTGFSTRIDIGSVFPEDPALTVTLSLAEFKNAVKNDVSKRPSAVRLTIDPLGDGVAQILIQIFDLAGPLMRTHKLIVRDPVFSERSGQTQRSVQVDSKYLRQFLAKARGRRIAVGIDGDPDSCLLRADNGLVGLIMPVRVG